MLQNLKQWAEEAWLVRFAASGFLTLSSSTVMPTAATRMKSSVTGWAASSATGSTQIRKRGAPTTEAFTAPSVNFVTLFAGPKLLVSATMP